MDDLTNTRDQELQLLENRIESWERYLESLQYAMERAERIKRDYLIAELLGINTEQEYAEIQKQIHDQITNDWQSFETRYNESLKLIVGDTTNFDAENVSSWIDAVNNFNEVVNNYNGVFNSFFEQYKENILELDSLQKQAQEILNREWELSKNDVPVGDKIMDIYDDITTGSNNTGIFGSGGTIVDGVLMSNADAQMINALRAQYAKKQQEYNQLRDTQGKEAADAKYQTQFQNLHNSAEAIRRKYGYSGSYNGNAQEIIDWDTYNKYKQQADQIYAETTGKAWQNGQDLSAIYGNNLATLNDYNTGVAKGNKALGATNNNYLNDESKFIRTSMGLYKTLDGVHYYAVNSLGQYNSNVASQYQMLQMTTQGHLVDQDGNIVAEQQDYNQLNQINLSTVASWAALNADSKVQMDYYTLTFEQFLDKYESQIQEFARLQQEQASVSGGSIGGGSGGSGGGNTTYNPPGQGNNFADDDRYSGMPEWVKKEIAENQQYWQNWNAEYQKAKAAGDTKRMAEAQAGMKRANDKANELRRKYGGWDGGEDGTGHTIISSNFSSGSGSGTGGNRGGTGTTSLAQRRSRANGILGGPVTETAEYMLHGSPSEPEYVLNNDQAWRLLTNITTLEMDKELPNTNYKSKEEKTRQKDKEGNVGKTVNYYDYSTLNYNDSSIDNSIGGNNQPITITDPTYTYPGGLDYANPDSVLDIYGGSKYPNGGSNIGTGTNTGVKDEITIDDDGLKSYNWGSGNGVRETKSGLLEYENPEENDRYLQSILDSSADGTNIIPDGKGGYYVIYSPNYELVNGLTTKIRDGVDLDNLDPELLSQLSYKHILSASSNNPVSSSGQMGNSFIQSDQKNPRFWVQEGGSWDVAGQKVWAGSLGYEGLRVNQALGLSGNRVSLDTLDKNSALMNSGNDLSSMSQDEKDAWKLILGDTFGSRIESSDLAISKPKDGIIYNHGLPESELHTAATIDALNARDIAAKHNVSVEEQEKIFDAMMMLAEANYFGETDRASQILAQLETTANKYGYSVGSNGLGNTTKITSAMTDFVNSTQYQAKKQYEQELGSTIETLIDNSAKQRTDSVKYALEYGLLTEGGLEQYQKHMTGEYTGRLISGGKTYDWKDFDINSSDLITTEDIAAYAIAKDLGRELASWNFDTFLKRNIDGIREYKKQTEQFEKTAQASSKVEQTINDNDKKIYEGRYQNSVDSLNKMANSYSRQEALNDSHLTAEQVDVLYSGKNAQQQDTINKQLVSAWSMFNTDSKAQQLLASGNMSQFIQEYGASVAQFGEDAKKMSDTHNNILDSLTNFQQGTSKFNEAVGSMIQTGNQTIIDGINNANKLTSDYYESIRNSYNYGSYSSGSSSSDKYYLDKYQSERGDYVGTGQGFSYGYQQSGMSSADQKKIEQAQKDYQNATAKGDTAAANKAHQAAEAIRDKYGYSGGDDGSHYNTKNSGSGSKSGSGSGSKSVSGSGNKTGGGSKTTNTAKNILHTVAKTVAAVTSIATGGKKRANGILGGPVDTTELYMLHGTKNSPEYVLNSKQAYTLLRNMSTMSYNGSSRLSEDDRKIILQAQKDYQSAVANNDKNAMELAHSVAEKVRSKYGYSGGTTSNDVSVLGEPPIQDIPTRDIGKMSQKDAELIAQAQKDYQTASSKGDKSGMSEAHAKAEAVRASYGYSGGIDGSKVIPIKDTFSDDVNKSTLKEYTMSDVVRTGQVGNIIPGMSEEDIKKYNETVTELIARRVAGYKDATDEKVKKAIIEGEKILNKYGFTGSVTGTNISSIEDKDLSNEDKTKIFAAKRKWLQAQKENDTQKMEEANKEAEAIRNKYGYSGGTTSKANTPSGQGGYSQKTSSDVVERAKSHAISATIAKAQEMYQEGARTGNRAQMEEAHAIAERARNQAQYSGLLQIQTGRLEKAVNGISEIYSKSSSTSQSSVEQRLLLNLKSTKTPEYKSLVEKQGNETKYVLNGDVVIDGTSDPREFWSNVSSAMQNRSNVTKNVTK